jgi:hypothetical protein
MSRIVVTTIGSLGDLHPQMGISLLCLGGLFVSSLAFGYKVGRNYKR